MAQKGKRDGRADLGAAVTLVQSPQDSVQYSRFSSPVTFDRVDWRKPFAARLLNASVSTVWSRSPSRPKDTCAIFKYVGARV